MNPALEKNYVELIYPDSLNHPQQKYRLTERGREMQKTLK